MKIAFIGDSLTEGIAGVSYYDILQNKLSSHEFFNYGKGGDTVISLFRRVHKMGFSTSMDIGFLWIGVNDVVVKTSWPLRLLKRLRKQPWAKDHAQFYQYYRSLLELLENDFTHIFVLPPLLIGEDIHNAWNMELAVLSEIIHGLSLLYPKVEFVDLREHFISQLATKNVSPYIPKSVFRVIFDAFVIKSPEESAKVATERGFHYTIDGVHLNRAGAEMVADVLLGRIRSKLKLIAGNP